MYKYPSAYLELLKKVLVDFDHVESFEMHPIEQINPTWKSFWLYPLNRLLLKRNFSLVKRRYVNVSDRLYGKDWPSQAKTMIGIKRLDNIEFCLRQIASEHIEGDLIETGVWRGGATMFMRAALNELQIRDKKIWLADSFKGLPTPKTKQYKADSNTRLHKQRILRVSRKEVEQNFRKFDLLDESIQFLEGWFSHTLPKAPVKELSLLRLDGDLYESTHLALTHLYPKLVPGGFIIIDDFNAFPFCKQAVLDYRTKHHIVEPIVEIDQEAVFWKKEE